MSICGGHACSKFALDVWIELFDTYDGSVVFNLHQRINSLT